MPDSREYPDELNTVIYALMAEGLNGSQIHKRLTAGEDGMPPLVIAPRSIRDRMQRLRRARGDPQQSVAPGEEATVADAIRRRLLEVSRRQVEQLETLSHRRILKPAEADTLARLSRSVDDMKRRDQLARARDADPDDNLKRGHEDAGLRPHESELDRLAALEDDEETEA